MVEYEFWWDDLNDLVEEFSSHIDRMKRDGDPDRPLAIVSRGIAKGKLSSSVDDAVYDLVRWHYWKALLQLAQEDEAGWKSLSHWCAWSEIKLQIYCWKRGTRNFDNMFLSNIDDAVIFVLFGIAAKHTTFLKWFASQLVEWLPLEEAWEKWDLLIPYTARLLGKELGFEVDTEALEYDLGPYQELFDNWDSPWKTAGAIGEVCDYHNVAREKCNRDDFSVDAHFNDRIMISIPLDVIALARVRERQGLKTPKVEHPELRVPFFPAPAKLKFPYPKEVTALRKLLPKDFLKPKSTRQLNLIGPFDSAAVPVPEFESDLDRVLAKGTDAELDEIDDCCTIDWKADFNEIVAEFQRYLPDDYVNLEFEGTEEDGITAVVVSTKHDEERIPIEDGPVSLRIAYEISLILRPEFEAHEFKRWEGDTSYYLVRPREWWDEFRSAFPDRYKELFDH